MSSLANFFTVLSLACGFISIIFSLEGHFTFASWAIILSVIFDGLDGQIARMSASVSEFGKEMDSLVDVISFGIAPSILGYSFIYHDFYLWAIAVLFVYLVCSVIRLAKYNITVKEKTDNYFSGLPTTVSGGTLASFILMYRKNTYAPSQVIFLLLVIILAILMVSKMKYVNLDGLKILIKKVFFWVGCVLVIGILVLIGVYFFKINFILELIIFLLFALYVIFSPLLLVKFV